MNSAKSLWTGFAVSSALAAGVTIVIAAGGREPIPVPEKPTHFIAAVMVDSLSDMLSEIGISPNESSILAKRIHDKWSGLDAPKNDVFSEKPNPESAYVSITIIDHSHGVAEGCTTKWLNGFYMTYCRVNSRKVGSSDFWIILTRKRSDGKFTSDLLRVPVPVLSAERSPSRRGTRPDASARTGPPK